MKTSPRRVRAIFDKELREYRHSGNLVYAMAILPLIFLIQPVIVVFTLSTSASASLRNEHALLYMLAIPVLVPAALASYAVVGERLQGTLEPVLSTPVRSEELLLGKALAAFVPSVAVAYAIFALFVAAVELFAHPGVAPAFIRGPDLLAQLVSRRCSRRGRSGSGSPYRPGRAIRAPRGSWRSWRACRRWG
jgi:ABC-type transport system involved in multi-copper enzyme maturation permease subunit